ncbi:MAG: hypothetical protein K2V38_16270, partial [Gemmataceae bacterium]|nr:hypothetical protein [Gemmataceae bacterium]
WLAFGRGEKGEVAKNPPTPPGDTRPMPTPEPDTKKDKDPPKIEPKVEPKVEPRVRLEADFAGLKPFVDHIAMAPTAVPGGKEPRLVEHTGDGKAPDGWVGRCWDVKGEMELFADDLGGKPCLGIRNLKAGSAMLFTPRFRAPSGTVRVQFEYASAAPREKPPALRFKSSDQRPVREILKLQTGGGWRTEELLVDLKGASGGYFEFHNNDPSGSAFRLRSLTVTEPNPENPDRVRFELDAASLPDFGNKKLGRRKVSGDDDPRVRGVAFVGYRADTESQWTCGPVGDGSGRAKAVGFTNVNASISTQIAIELEGNNGTGVSFAPGQLIRVRITYRTAGKAHGQAYFQHQGDYSKMYEQILLTNSNDEWVTEEVVFTRGPQPLRYLIDALEPGAGNTLYVQTVTVAEIGPPPGKSKN